MRSTSSEAMVSNSILTRHAIVPTVGPQKAEHGRGKAFYCLRRTRSIRTFGRRCVKPLPDEFRLWFFASLFFASFAQSHIMSATPSSLSARSFGRRFLAFASRRRTRVTR